MSSDFSVSWQLSRGRFDQEVLGLSEAQLRFRLYPGSLTIGEMALHVAGVEVWFICQMTGRPVPDDLVDVARCATEGVVNDHPFPFEPAQIDPATVADRLARAAAMVQEVIFDPTAEWLAAEIKSALGPIIDGRGALARLTFHPAYHQGQAYQIKNAPGFPR